MTWSLSYFLGSGNNFKYERLREPKSQIRLLELLSSDTTSKRASPVKLIECRLTTYSLKDVPRYEALSYAWGNLEQERIPIRILKTGLKYNYTETRVTINLYAALKRLRPPQGSRLLWIDQLCIDQSESMESREEKKLQVDMMTKIYQAAEKTLIWLGDDDTSTSLVTGMLQELPRIVGCDMHDTSNFQGPDQAALYGLVDFARCGDGLARDRRDALISFLNRRWFERAWVYQEAVVSQEVEIMLGSYYFSLDLLVRLVYSTYTLIKEDSDKQPSRDLKRTKGYGTLRAMWDDRIRYQNDPESLDVLYILWCGRKYFQASDPRDLVYSFLGVQNLKYPVEPDYSAQVTITLAFTTLARNMIRSTQDLRIFQAIVPTAEATLLAAGEQNKFPSWVPNWSEKVFISGPPLFAPGIACHFNACRDQKHVGSWNVGSPWELYVKAHIIDCVDKRLLHAPENTIQGFLKRALKLDELVAILRVELQGRKPNIDRDYSNLRETAFRTLLADGAFSLRQPLEHDISELLRIYDADDPRTRSKTDRLLHRYLQSTAAVAEKKQLFMTRHLDIGLGYCGITEGDLVVIINGCKTPCILRPTGRGRYEFVGQCYVDGWMYKESQDRLRRRWWEEEAEALILV